MPGTQRRDTRAGVHRPETCGRRRQKHGDGTVNATSHLPPRSAGRHPTARPHTAPGRRPTQEVAVVNTGDTAWILTSAALVLLMTPGLALFYGGMVRAKSVLNMMMMSFGALALISVLWVIYGYSIAFGNDVGGGLLGNPVEFFGLKGLMEDTTSEAGGLPTMAFVGFQAVFAIITVALISGAIADRAKFGAWMVFAGVWATIVYFPVAHWVFDFRPRRRRHHVGGWIANNLGGHRLRRWYRGAHQRRCGGPRARAGPRQAPRLRPRGDAPAQPAAGHDRRRAAVVRLVRLQRRLRARRRTTPRRSSGSTRWSPPVPPRSAGCWWRRSATVTRPRWAPRPASSPAWSPSPRPVRRSRRSARSSSAPSPVCCVPWPSA